MAFTPFVPTPGSPVILLNAVTSTGVSSVVLQPTRSISGGPTLFTWQMAITGAPASVSTTLQGSLDGLNWATLDTSTNTTTELRFVANSPVVYLRLNLGTLTGGTVPTVTGTVMVTDI